MNDSDTDALDALFAEVSAMEIVPSDAVQDRMLADARTVVAEAEATAKPRNGETASRGWLASLLDGWGAVGGLTACVALGVGLGVVQPAALTGLSGLFATGHR